MIKALEYLRDGSYLDPQTTTLEVTLLTFNSRLRAFATWTLPLTRKSDGRFYGRQLLLHAFERAWDFDTPEGSRRFKWDLAYAAVATVHTLWILDELLVMRARNRSEGVRSLLQFGFDNCPMLRSDGMRPVCVDTTLHEEHCAMAPSYVTLSAVMHSCQ